MSVRTGFQLQLAMTVTGHSVSGPWRQPTALPLPAQASWGLLHPCPWPRTQFQPSLGPSVPSQAHPEHLSGLLWLTSSLAHASGQLVSVPTMFCIDGESEQTDFASHICQWKHSETVTCQLSHAKENPLWSRDQHQTSWITQPGVRDK